MSETEMPLKPEQRSMVELAEQYAETLASVYDPERTTELSNAMLNALETIIKPTKHRYRQCDILVAIGAVLVTQLRKAPAPQHEAVVLGMSILLHKMMEKAAECEDARHPAQ